MTDPEMPLRRRGSQNIAPALCGIVVAAFVAGVFVLQAGRGNTTSADAQGKAPTEIVPPESRSPSPSPADLSNGAASSASPESSLPSAIPSTPEIPTAPGTPTTPAPTPAPRPPDHSPVSASPKPPDSKVATKSPSAAPLQPPETGAWCTPTNGSLDMKSEACRSGRTKDSTIAWAPDDADGDSTMDSTLFREAGFTVRSGFTSIDDRDYHPFQWSGGELRLQLAGENAQMSVVAAGDNNHYALWEDDEGKASMAFGDGSYYVMVEPADSQRPLTGYVLTVFAG